MNLATQLPASSVARSPYLPILFSSGYAFQLLDNALEPGTDAAVIVKPYHAEELLIRVREAIDKPQR